MNTLLYISITLLGIPLRILSAIFYPIVFLFRHKVLSFMLARVQEDDINRVFVLKPGYKKWKLYLHPYFWMFCFTTGLTDRYEGPEWFMREQKLNWWFNTYLFPQTTFTNKWRYFWICYCWQALRNPHYAFNEWFFREGKWKDNTVRIEYCDPPEGSIYKYWDIMPNLKWDEGHESGKVLRFQTEDTPVNEIWLCTHLGKKKITFTTYKGHRRFMYAFTKIIYLRPLKLNLIIKHQFGWGYWNGIVEFQFKHILRKA